MHRNDERVWLPELMQLKLSTLEKLVSIFSNGQIYIFCTNKEQVCPSVRPWMTACMRACMHGGGDVRVCMWGGVV